MTKALPWWKEPLLHFLILAAGLFAVQRFWSPAPDDPQPGEIVVTQQRIDSLALAFLRTWQRPPTQPELDGLINDYITEEVFYREALKMGLDRDDTLIRRRMRQKLEVLAEDFADAIQPTDQQLQEYLDTHPDSFRTDGRTTFRQIFLSPQRRGNSLAADAEKLLQQLRSEETAADPETLGDPFLLPFRNDDMRETQTANEYGREFAEQLQEAQTGQWTGPITSAYGSHLAFVRERTPGSMPQLAEVREQVQRDWYAARRAESKEEFSEALLQKYNVTIQHPQPADTESASTE